MCIIGLEGMDIGCLW